VISLPKKPGKDFYGKWQPNLDFFFVFNRDREAYEKALQARLEYEENQRRILVCETCILKAVSEEPLDIMLLYFCKSCRYRDIRDAVIAKLKLEKVIKLRWGVSPDGNLIGAYFLNKRK